MQRDGQAQERAQAKLERNRRWFEKENINLSRSGGDRSACRVLTPPSAPDATVLASSKLRFWHALEGKIKEEETCRQGS